MTPKEVLVLPDLVYHAAILRSFEGDWRSVRSQLTPGGHAFLIGDNLTLSVVRARKAGLEIRDTVAILSRTGLQFAVLLRNPLSESSVAAQLVKTGTGALNIDACRIAGTVQASAGAVGGYGGSKSGQYQLGTGQQFHDRGRWPSNLVLIHEDACQRVEPTWKCVRTCPLVVLDRQVEDGARYYKQVGSFDELLSYLGALILPEGGLMLAGVSS